jgi:hypothetical protein
VVKFGFRRGDAAPLSIIEFTDFSDNSQPKPRKKRPPRGERVGEPRERRRAAAAG